MLLRPGGYILEHSDTQTGIPYTERKKESIFSALNIFITQPKDCALEHLSNGVVPFNPLEVYLFNNDEYHHAYNNSKENRIHIDPQFVSGPHYIHLRSLYFRNSE